MDARELDDLELLAGAAVEDRRRFARAAGELTFVAKVEVRGKTAKVGLWTPAGTRDEGSVVFAGPATEA
jgi:hypothetical protein